MIDLKFMLLKIRYRWRCTADNFSCWISWIQHPTSSCINDDQLACFSRNQFYSRADETNARPNGLGSKPTG
jgi:hypothetical protein